MFRSFILGEREIAAILTALEMAQMDDPHHVRHEMLRDDELLALRTKLCTPATAPAPSGPVDFVFKITDSLNNVSYLKRTNGSVRLVSSGGTPLALSNICPRDSEGMAIKLKRCSGEAEADRIIREGVYRGHGVEVV